MFSERAVNKSFTSKNSIYQENEAWKFSSEPLDGARPKAGGLADTAWHNQHRSSELHFSHFSASKSEYKREMDLVERVQCGHQADLL